MIKPKKKKDLNAKITEIENKIPRITGLATNSQPHNVIILVKKTDYNTKISEIEKKISYNNDDKYITTPEFNSLAAKVFTTRLGQADLVTKADFDTKLQDISKRITSNKTKHLLVENELKKLKTFDFSYFRGKSHFEEDGTQNYLVFQPMYRYFKKIAGVGNGNYIYFWKYTPELNHYRTKARVKLSGSCLNKDKATYNHGTIVNIYIVMKEVKIIILAVIQHQKIVC